jgi:hypothetical protein
MHRHATLAAAKNFTTQKYYMDIYNKVTCELRNEG